MLGVRHFAAAAIGAAVLLVAAPQAEAAVIKVTTTTDGFAPGSGCSLREAIYSANKDIAFGDCSSGSGADEVRLTDGSVYTLSLVGVGEDNDETGDLDVDSIVSLGPKQGKATIDALDIDRVLDVLPGSELNLSRTTVTGGFGLYPPNALSGAGIRVDQARLETSKVKIEGNRTLGNSANNGGGLSLGGGSVVKLDRTKVRLNEAGNVGGGIIMYDGTLKITRSTISGNESGYLGAGMYLSGSAAAPPVFSLKDSTVSGNSSGENGGGLYFSLYDQEDDESAELTNVTVSGNSAEVSGGGLYGYVGRSTLNGVTVTDNTADADGSGDGFGGGIGGGQVSFENSIVFGNESLNPGDTTPDCGGGGSSLGGSMTGTDCSKADGDSHKDPKLKPLADNGGSTLTHAIPKSSSAVGRGDRKTAPNRDQRDLERDKHPDSGAYERIKGK